MRRVARLLTLAGAAVVLAQQAAAAPPQCRYDLAVGAPPRVEVEVRVDCGDLPVERLATVDRVLARHVTAVTDAAGAPLARDGDDWLLPATGARTARYRLSLGDMAAAERNYTTAYAIGRSVLAELSSWVMLPEPLPPGAVLHLVPRLAEGTGFATALQRRADGLDLPADALRFAGYSVFGAFREARLSPPGPGALAPGASPARRAATADIRLVTLDHPIALPAGELEGWVADTAGAVGRFWQGFPVDRLLLVVLPQPGGERVPYGRVIGGGGASLMVMLGERVAKPTLYEDWVLIHEMVHLGSPFVRRSGWMTEGFATYFEPIIRYRAGRRSAEK